MEGNGEMVASLLCALSVCSGWKLTDLGIWQNSFGDQVAVSKQPPRLLKRDMLRRLGRYCSIFPKAVLLSDIDSNVCLRTTSTNSTLLCGFVGRTWATGEFKQSDWRKSLETFPDQAVASLAKISNRNILYRVDNSELKLLSGKVISLPSDWFWLDEKLGCTLELAPNWLCSSAFGNGIAVKQFRLSKRAQMEKSLGCSGFSAKLITSGFEFNPARKTTGYCVRLKDEWLVLSTTHMSPPVLKRVAQFCSWLKQRVDAK